jgi:hypothetical protein
MFSYIDPSFFFNIKQLASLLAITTIDANTDIGHEFFDYAVSPMLSHNFVDVPSSNIVYIPTHQANLASDFRYWRGGQKFFVYITCNKFVSFRFRVVWMPDITDDIAVPLDNGDLYQQVIDVNGDCVYGVTIPFLSDTKWKKVPNYYEANTNTFTYDVHEYFNGRLIFQVISPPAVTQVSTATTVYISLYVASSETMEFAEPKPFKSSYTMYSYPAPSNLEAQGEYNIQSTVLGPLPYIHECEERRDSGFTMGETITNRTELLHRYTYRSENALPPNTWYFHPLYDLDIVNLSPLWRYLKSVLYFRGSFRYKLVFEVGAVDYTFWIRLSHNDQVTNNGWEGLIIKNSRQGNVVEFEIPFYYNKNFYSNGGYVADGYSDIGFTVEIKGASGDAINYHIYQALGDDFTTSLPFWNTPVHYTVSSAKKGQNKVATDLKQPAFSLKQLRGSNRSQTKNGKQFVNN